MDLGHPAAAVEGYAGGDLSWVSPTAYVHACGNAIRFSTVGEGNAGHRRTVWGQGNSIGAVAACPHRRVILYAERQKELQDPRVFVYDVERDEVVQVLQCEGELGIVAIALCRDEPWAAVLGDAPEHAVMLWDWALNPFRRRTHHGRQRQKSSMGGRPDGQGRQREQSRGAGVVARPEERPPPRLLPPRGPSQGCRGAFDRTESTLVKNKIRLVVSGGG